VAAVVLFLKADTAEVSLLRLVLYLLAVDASEIWFSFLKDLPVSEFGFDGKFLEELL